MGSESVTENYGNYLSNSWWLELFEEQAPFSHRVLPKPAVAYQMLPALDRLVDKDFAKNEKLVR